MLYLALYCTNTIILLINLNNHYFGPKIKFFVPPCLNFDVLNIILTMPLNTQEKIGSKSFVPEKIIHCKGIKLIIIYSSQLRYLFRSCLYTQIFKTNINLWSPKVYHSIRIYTLWKLTSL
jgi:hypothetical protein